MQVGTITATEILKIIDNFLGHYCKTLTNPQKILLTNKQTCYSPVFLRTVLEELRVFGVFEQLTSRIYLISLLLL